MATRESFRAENLDGKGGMIPVCLNMIFAHLALDICRDDAVGGYLLFSTQNTSWEG